MNRVLALIVFCVLCSCAATKASVKQMSVDLGADVYPGVYPSLGVSVPVGPVWLSTGVWAGWDYASGDRAYGPYVTVGWSWSPFAGGTDGTEDRNTEDRSRRNPRLR